LAANRFVFRDNKPIPLDKFWLKHPERRQYKGLVFAPQRDVPGHYNLWQGFAVQPKRGDCSKFLAHLKDNVCRGNEELNRWVIGWLAAIIQRPDQKVGTSLVLRGKQGVGKTIIGKTMGRLLGPHYSLVSDPRYITGRFNSHLTSCLLLHADESFWAGDRAAEGKLKDLVTGDYQYIELKGKEAFRVANYVRLLVTGNPDWLVPAGFRERRFATLDVGEAQIQNTAYFKAIEEEMDKGGAEALLDYLMKFDLSEIDLRVIPTTQALLDQKFSTLEPVQSWWLDVLSQGELPFADNNPLPLGSCYVKDLYQCYIKHANLRGTRHKLCEQILGTNLRKLVVGLEKRRPAGTGARPRAYYFPPLAECRKQFEQIIGQDIDWGDESKKEDWGGSNPM
jgi:phage/plasmid-associated DNA primase